MFSSVQLVFFSSTCFLSVQLVFFQFNLFSSVQLVFFSVQLVSFSSTFFLFSSTCFLQQDGRVSNFSPYHVISIQPPSLISMDDLQFDQHALSLYRFYRERGCLVTFQLWTTEDGGEHLKSPARPPYPSARTLYPSARPPKFSLIEVLLPQRLGNLQAVNAGTRGGLSNIGLQSRLDRMPLELKPVPL